MESTTNKNKHFFGLRFIVAVAALFIVVAGLKAAQALLIPFFFAIFLAVLGSAPLAWLKDRGVPTLPSVLAVTVLIMSIFIGLGILLGTSANEFTQELPKYEDKLNHWAVSINEWVEARGVDLSRAALFEATEPARLMGMFGKTLKGFVDTLSKTLLVLIFLIFMLHEAALFRLKIEVALQESLEMGRFEKVVKDIQKYLGIKTFTSALTGILVWLWVYAWGLDFAVLWGLVAFILNYIPIIGSIVASIPALILAAVQLGSGITLALGAGYLVINIGISNFIEPIFMGRRLGLSPLIVLMSLIFWGWVWGPAGMLLSVPLTMIVKILLEHSEDFRWIALLMDIRPRRDRQG